MSLSERTGSVLDATEQIVLGMAVCGRTPLTELLEFLQTILADEGELSIEHGSHVAGIEEETVASFPVGILRIVNEELAVEGVDEVSTTHSATGVTTLSFFNHCGSKNTDVVCCAVHNFVVVHIFI